MVERTLPAAARDGRADRRRALPLTSARRGLPRPSRRSTPTAARSGFVEGDEVVLVHDRGFEDPRWTPLAAFPIDGRDPIGDADAAGHPDLAGRRREDWAQWPELRAATIGRFAALGVVPLIAAESSARRSRCAWSQEPRALDRGRAGFLLALADQAAACARPRAAASRSAPTWRGRSRPGCCPTARRGSPGSRSPSATTRSPTAARSAATSTTASRPPGALAGGVGDVSGKGSAAAVLTGLARHTLRAIAPREERPEAMLRLPQRGAAAPVDRVAFSRSAARRSSPPRRRLRGAPAPPAAIRIRCCVRAGARAAEEVVVRGTLLGVEPDSGAGGGRARARARATCSCSTPTGRGRAAGSTAGASARSGLARGVNAAAGGRPRRPRPPSDETVGGARGRQAEPRRSRDRRPARHRLSRFSAR